MTLVELFKINDLKPGYTHIENDVSYKFVEEGSRLYIHFEHSNGKVDWAHNFMFKKQPYKDMQIPYKVHGGFLTCWKTVEDIIIEKITEKESIEGIEEFKWKEIFIVGYSHGAALAAFCHECCWFHRRDIFANIKTVAFEGPRIYGNFFVKEELKERWLNFRLIRNDTDMVTFLPPWLFGFCHVGKIIHIGKGKGYGVAMSHAQENVIPALTESPYNETWETSLFE